MNNLEQGQTRRPRRLTVLLLVALVAIAAYAVCLAIPSTRDRFAEAVMQLDTAAQRLNDSTPSSTVRWDGTNPAYLTTYFAFDKARMNVIFMSLKEGSGDAGIVDCGKRLSATIQDGARVDWPLFQEAFEACQRS